MKKNGQAQCSRPNKVDLGFRPRISVMPKERERERENGVAWLMPWGWRARRRFRNFSWERKRERRKRKNSSSVRGLSSSNLLEFPLLIFPFFRHKNESFNLSFNFCLPSFISSFSSILRSAVFTDPLIPASFRHLITFQGSESSLEFFSSRGVFEVSTFGKWNAPSCSNLNCEWCRVFVYSPHFC